MVDQHEERYDRTPEDMLVDVRIGVPRPETVDRDKVLAVLPYGTPEDVRAEVRERIRVLGEGGGYICGGDHAILDRARIGSVQPRGVHRLAAG